jgi:hypothetical protein
MKRDQLSATGDRDTGPITATVLREGGQRPDEEANQTSELPDAVAAARQRGEGEKIRPISN